MGVSGAGTGDEGSLFVKAADVAQNLFEEAQRMTRSRRDPFV